MMIIIMRKDINSYNNQLVYVNNNINTRYNNSPSVSVCACLTSKNILNLADFFT